MALNPTFSTTDDVEMLDESCPTMIRVVECGFNRLNARGTDIVPVKINLKLMDDMDGQRRRDPLKSFPEFEPGFKRLFDYSLRWGKVVLVFGEVAWSYVKAWRKIEDITLSQFPELELFVEVKVCIDIDATNIVEFRIRD